MSARLLADSRAGRVGGTCVVTAEDGHALYFSRYPIPHGAGGSAPLRLHLGVYAYRPAALRAYAAWPPSPLELAEGLEQLRFLAAGWPVHVVEAQPRRGGFGKLTIRPTSRSSNRCFPQRPRRAPFEQIRNEPLAK